MKRCYWAVVAGMFVAVVVSKGSFVDASEGQGGSKKWITRAGGDPERFQRIEKYLRGFDQPMWEVGERYEKLYAALGRDNVELASYHWAKIKLTIENGTMKRPARRANADALFLNDTWSAVNDALASGESTTRWKGFEAARTACMKCHEAEGVGYMNDQPMFSLRAAVSHTRK
jgi:cytochrome c553